MKKNILFNNFSREYKTIKEEINSAITGVLNRGWYILGEQVKLFETELAEYLGLKFCVGCASGTDAIALALMALTIGAGEEVITTDVTAFPTIRGIEMVGAIPVVVDINPDDGLIDCNKIEEAISSRTKAIVPVHLYGQCADMECINNIAQKHNLFVIEDCAQAGGAKYNDKRAGTLSDVSAFSFYPTKNLGAYGDGGAVGTNNEIIYNKLLKLRNYGQTDRYFFEDYGFNSRLDEIQAAILRVKLKYLDDMNQKRNKLANYYVKHLNNSIVTTLSTKDHNYNIYHLFIIKVPDRDAFQTYMKENGIQTLVHYPVPCRRQKAFQKFWNNAYDGVWESDLFVEQIVSIPIYPELTGDEVEYITEKINSFKL
jgi:dTDP-4-amino-4,6-dideoxygalactose transaminase